MGWLLRLFRKSRTESELDQELRFHLERQIFANLSAGVSPEEARRDALIKLGGLEQTKESDCDTRGSLTINSVLRDLHFGFRLLRKNPAFTLIVVGLLAFGIGVNTAFFSVLDATLLRPLPVRDPESLVRIVQKFPKVGSMNSLPRAYYDTLHEHSTMLPAVFGEAIVDTTLSGMGPAESVRVYLPTPEYFEGLGTHALHGRTLTTSDAVNQAGPIPAVLSYRFWKQRFDGNVNAIGRTLVLHQNVFVIVGVLPREFNGLSADTAPDVRVPLRALPLLWDPSSSRPMAYVEFELAGRLKPGVTRQQAQAECLALWLANVTDYYPHYPEQARFTSRIGVALDPLKHGVSRVGERYGDTMKLLMVCGGLLLLTVCATLGGLLFARSAVRRYEIGVRLAIGATPGQIMRQMITESLLLTIAGGIGGLVIAYLLPSVLASYIPPVRDVTGTRMALSIDLGLNYRVLAFSFILSAATALLFALAPAIITSRVPIDSVLRDTRASARVLGRQVVVIFQIALCTVALVLAGLLIRTIERLSRVDTGFDQDHVVTLSVSSI